MINLEKLENNFEEVANKLSLRGVNLNDLLLIKEKINDRKVKIKLINKLRSDRNKLSSLKLRDNQQVISLKDEIKCAEQELDVILKELSDLCNNLPNIPSANTPLDAGGDRLVYTSDSKRTSKNPFTYEQIIDRLGVVDFEKGVKLSGSKFVVYKDLGVKLLNALSIFMLAENNKRGYQLINAPYLVNSSNLYNSGQLPKFADDLFKLEKHDLVLIPTSEVTLVNLYQNEIIDSKDLPIKLTAYSPCFRAEAGSAGQENKGLVRLHQFNKVELVRIVKPEESYFHLDEIVNDAKNILEKLEISYRVIELCYKELGVSSAKTYDIEIWLPNSKRWLEISSCTNCEDFQANRANIRYKKDGKKVILHTLNGSSLAIDRLLLAIFEYYYNEEEGVLETPDAIKKYLDLFAV